jgi:PAS domain S-box-containing protein
MANAVRPSTLFNESVSSFHDELVLLSWKEILFGVIEAEKAFCGGDDMPAISTEVVRRYGSAVVSVAVAIAIRAAVYPILGNRYPFILFFVAVVLTAGYGGYGPSLLALFLSWLSVDLLFLSSGANPSPFETRSQVAFGFFVIGLAVTVLGGFWRSARERAKSHSLQLQQAFETQNAVREWLEITLASIADAVITTDPNGNVIFLNPVACRLTGWTSDQAMGRPLKQVFRTVQEITNKTEDLPIAKVVGNGEVIVSNDEVVLIAENGARRSIEHNAAPIRDSNGKIKGVVIVFRDVTERHRVEQAKKESDERFHQLADHISDVFWIYELDGSKIGYISPAYESLWGRSCQSVYERPLSYLEAVHEEDRQRATKAHQSLERGKATALEYRIVRPDGRIRWVWDRGFPIEDECGRVIRIAGIAEDITERKRVEQALRESEERFRTLADATPVLIWGSGTDKGCNYFNKQWLDFTGRTIEQEMGDGWSEGVHPEDWDRCLATYGAAFNARTPFTMEYRLKRHDGEYRWVVDTGVPRFTPDSTFTGYIGSCIDITDRKRTEEELRESDRRKEEFLAVLSHELRNPLAPMQTALDLLEQRGLGAAGTERELATIKRQVQNLKRLVDDLMDVSRISRGKIELQKCVVELAPLVSQVVDALRPLLEDQRKKLHVSIPDNSICLEADPTRLEQLLFNLLMNASKFTPRGGQIWLEIEPVNDEVVIRVRDTGIGIEAELLPKVFDLFMQGERRIGLSHEGGGIGLSLARNLVELHGGTIKADSPGRDMGTEIVVRLPVISTVPSERPQSPQVIQADVFEPLPRRRILIVDDNVQAAESLGRLMSEVFGQEVRVVYDGVKALETAQSFLPHVILLDLQMAGMDGYEVAMRLRAHPECSNALIVAVTGWGHEEDRRRSREMGFDLHLVKPVTASDLRGVLIDLKSKLEEQGLPELVVDSAHYCAPSRS